MMEPLSFWNYLKDAFKRKVPVPLLGPMPVNQMALGVFAVLGLANPGFWFLGAAGELAYLFATASNPRYQKLVQGERLLAVQRDWEERVARAVTSLRPENRHRYQRLLEQMRRILGISESLSDASLGNFRDLRARSLNQLLGIYLRLLTSSEVIADNVRGLDRAKVETEIANLEKRLAAARDDALRRSLEGTIAIQRKRLENLARAGSSLEVIAAELRRIEQQVELIREESAVTRKPAELSTRLDAVTSAMTETTRWMDEHRDFLSSLGTDEPSAQLADLPNLEALESE